MKTPEVYKDAPRHIKLLAANREAARKYYPRGYEPGTPAAASQYRDRIFAWDRYATARVWAKSGYPDEAAYDIDDLYGGLQEDGFLPNMRYAPKAKPWHVERLTFKDHGDSNYTQPPMDALAIQDVFEAYIAQNRSPEAYDFLGRNYAKATKRFEYFRHQRQSSPTNPLVWNIHPHETGRDSEVTFDFFKTKMRRVGANTLIEVDLANSALDYLSDMRLNLRLAKVGWDPEKARQLFGVNDVAFNVIYADNLSIMSGLALTLAGAQDSASEKAILLEQAAHYQRWSDKVGKAILDRMWFKEGNSGKGIFYALKPDGSPIQEVSPSNIYPLILPGLQPHQQTDCINAMLSLFNTRYPFASAATTSKGYDPRRHQIGRLWTGMKMIIADEYFVERGLLPLAEREPAGSLEGYLCAITADIVAEASKEVVKAGYAEGYSPETGRRFRRRKVRNFSWSTLADTMQHHGLAEALLDDDYFNLCRRIGRVIPFTKL